MNDPMLGRRSFMAVSAGCLLASAAGVRAGASAGRLSIGAWTSIAKAPLLAASGYDFVEEEVDRYLMPNAPRAAFDASLEAGLKAPIPVRSLVRLLPPSLQSVGPDTTHDAIVNFSETVFARARLAGAETIVFGSPRSRRIPEDFSRAVAEAQLVSLCQRLGPIAQANKVILALEPLNHTETNFINRIDEGAAIVRAVKHPAVRMVADLFHMRVGGEDGGTLIRNADLIQHVQIAEKQGRRALGTSGEDFTDYFVALQSAGYSGRLSVECLWTDIDGEAAGAIRTICAQYGAIDGRVKHP